MAPSSPSAANAAPVTTISQSPSLLVKKLSPSAKAPTRGSAFAAGYDIYASNATSVPKRGKTLVDTDLAIAVPEGTYVGGETDGRIAPRSGLAVKNFIDTGAGVIDADYRGQLKVLLFNHSDNDFEGKDMIADGYSEKEADQPRNAVKEGDRIAQLVLERVRKLFSLGTRVTLSNDECPDIYT
ncbi:MAG: hypothetical protein Q9178_000908 [Gyalolechia marmorata]